MPLLNSGWTIWWLCTLLKLLVPANCTSLFFSHQQLYPALSWVPHGNSLLWGRRAMQIACGESAPFFQCNRRRQGRLKQMKGWRLARTSSKHEMWPKTLLASIMKGLRLTTKWTLAWECAHQWECATCQWRPLRGPILGMGWHWSVDRHRGGNYNGPSFPNWWNPQRKSFLDLFLYFFQWPGSRPSCLQRWMKLLWIVVLSWAKIADGYDLRMNDRVLGLPRMRPPPVTKKPTLALTIFGHSFWCINSRWSCGFLCLRMLPFQRCLLTSFGQFVIKGWNANMADIFDTDWVICLDQSMTIYHNPWTCPSWIWCPQKPHPYGNSTQSGALFTIMFSVELVEGKDSPTTIPVEFKEKGRTAGILLRMLQTYFYTGWYMVLDSSFCVLKALFELQKVEVYGAGWLKKENIGLLGYRGMQCSNFLTRMRSMWGSAIQFRAWWMAQHTI